MLGRFACGGPEFSSLTLSLKFPPSYTIGTSEIKGSTNEDNYSFIFKLHKSESATSLATTNIQEHPILINIRFFFL